MLDPPAARRAPLPLPLSRHRSGGTSCLKVCHDSDAFSVEVRCPSLPRTEIHQLAIDFSKASFQVVNGHG